MYSTEVASIIFHIIIILYTAYDNNGVHFYLLIGLKFKFCLWQPFYFIQKNYID